MRRGAWLLLGAIIGAAAVGAAVAVLQPGGEARVSLKRLEDGRSEVAIQLRRADGSWGGRILPDARFAGTDAEPGRWLNSSPVALDGGPRALRLGLLDHFGGHGGITSVRAVQLAIKHVNAAGGVFGRPVEFAWRDTLEAPVFDQALALIDEEGVHAIIGPGTSSDALDIGRAIGKGRGIPLVTPSATSPAVAEIDDRGFVFRSVISDVAQGPILAQLAQAIKATTTWRSRIGTTPGASGWRRRSSPRTRGASTRCCWIRWTTRTSTSCARSRLAARRC